MGKPTSQRHLLCEAFSPLALAIVQY
uniref:Uncharacterized protein n=1 Tax=Arundo donax TaxID=35708 RepID=A0A0A9AYQ7_ARUDO